MKAIGIDIGLKGAIAKVETVDGRICFKVEDMPVIRGKKNEIDEARIKRILEEAREEGYLTAYIEKQQPFPQQGIVSTGRLMEQYGMIRGMLCALGIGYREVRPQAWKRWFGVKGKRESILVAQKLTNQQIEKDGRAEAILIAVYGIETRGI